MNDVMNDNMAALPISLSGGKRGDYQNCSVVLCTEVVHSHKHT